jgi:hypothetical protein
MGTEDASHPVATRQLERGLAALPPTERTVEDGILRETRQFRGLTRDRAIGYLTNLGGTRQSDSLVTGDGWQATLSTERVPVGPSYRLTEVTITWSGPREVLEPIIRQFRLKTFRAPG